ncbi:uncharacterized protein BP5553_10138 [Venustampulla echinocandica]|uniref:PLP-dependent transferase n=1 Tax=Venustampulla echinocandica TaxID=2656787 RepID=A0A370TAG6_9HELO|nr:uncharacterized protein BP5553_10138 [Venustampulla echinocandica]RDL30793.1 hypothetical protein BP5553_10138 [Venustampulla echinocandica]
MDGEDIDGSETSRKWPAPIRLGHTIPEGDVHVSDLNPLFLQGFIFMVYQAVSVSLPTWEASLGWATRKPDVINKMKSGYPRFFIHPMITHLASLVVKKYGVESSTLLAMLFPTSDVAERCAAYISKYHQDPQLQTMHVVPKWESTLTGKWTSIHAVLFSPENFPYAKKFWQHTGEGISSRRAELCLSLITAGGMERVDGGTHQPSDNADKVRKDLEAVNGNGNLGTGEKTTSTSLDHGKEAWKEKATICQRVAHLASNESVIVSSSDVFLYPAGMKAIFDIYRALLIAFPSHKKTICYGFGYVDTFKILSTFGPQDAILYGHGTVAELDELEALLESGTTILTLFCEVPTNPLLKSPDLKRIRKLADRYDFVVVCDDTIGTSANCDLIPYVDVIVTSLTKLFSGGCNVMGGTATVNPRSKQHDAIREALDAIFVDTYFPSDAIIMERNSHNYAQRVKATNRNAQLMAELLHNHPSTEQVFYPSLSRTKQNFDQCRRPDGGYGYLLAIKFKRITDAITFHDRLDVAKGPTLGTNFTIACAYTIFAHYNELQWAAQYGVEEYLVRVSVGMEPTAMLLDVVKRALKYTEVSIDG